MSNTININALATEVSKDFEKWEQTAPNIVNKGLGYVTAPVAFVLKPAMKKIAPLLEGVVSRGNEFISKAIMEHSDGIPDFDGMNEADFCAWFASADKRAKNQKALGIAAMTTEGGLMGLGGAVVLLADIPVAFGIILASANKIALTYGLPINTEEVQIAMLEAITAGSANNLKEKTAAIISMKEVGRTLATKSWNEIYKIAADNVVSVERIIVVVRELLKKLGINVSRKKATQLVPVVSAASGAIINAAWASDTLEAVRQYSRHWIAEKYAGAKFGLSK